MLIYDGACAFCRDAVMLVRRWDRQRAFEYVPLQDSARVVPLGIPAPALVAALHLRLPDGRVWAGADAVAEVLRRLPGKRWLAAPFALPGAQPLARRVYAWVAARRQCR